MTIVNGLLYKIFLWSKKIKKIKKKDKDKATETETVRVVVKEIVEVVA